MDADEDARIRLSVEIFAQSALGGTARARIGASTRALDVEIDALRVKLGVAEVAGAHEREGFGAEDVWAGETLWDCHFPDVVVVYSRC